MIEIPPKFAGKPPINPIWQSKSSDEQAMTTAWRGAKGLAEDVRHYGQWMQDEAFKKIGNLYPKVEITKQMAESRPDLAKYVGQKLAVMAYFWARTVKSPNPAFRDVDVPLASTFMLCSKSGKEAYVSPVIDKATYSFFVKTGVPQDVVKTRIGTSAGKRAGFLCLMSGTPLPYAYIREEGVAGRMGEKLMAIVLEGNRERVYISPTSEIEAIAKSAKPNWKPETELPVNPRDFKTPNYGLTTFGDLFTDRQLVALTTFSELVALARDKVKEDCKKLNMLDDGVSLEAGGSGVSAYADAISVYLSFGLSKCIDYWNSICTWAPHGEYMSHLFTRQAIPMAWDFAEANPFSSSSGNWVGMLVWAVRVIEKFEPASPGFVSQQDAQSQKVGIDKVVSTDPPYYDNIGYADLSDFFYVWQRQTLKPIFPGLFTTLAVPKAEELVATPYRHGSKEKAESFFLDGMTDAMHRLAEQAHPAFPVTIYYAFKQAENDSEEGLTNTGWDTFLAAVIKAGFAITGTWPIRTELSNRMIGSGNNALASSIVLVCRKRLNSAQTATRREFVSALKSELPIALAHLQAGNIAPVDLAQAAIGPGMAVYTRYSSVLDADGNSITVRAALALINQTLDEALASQEGDFDADTRWSLTWFEQFGFDEGDFGVAEQLSKSKNTAVQGLVDRGILLSKSGRVRLLKPIELATDSNIDDIHLTVWEMVHQIIRVLDVGGEKAAADLVARLGTRAETARELCYRLFALCERKKRSTEAIAYNSLVQSWPEISRLANEKSAETLKFTSDLFEQE